MNHINQLLILGGTSEAKEFGTFLKQREMNFDFSLSTTPNTDYGFDYTIQPVTGISCQNQLFQISFENTQKAYRLLIDLTHPHATTIAQMIDSIICSASLNKTLWRFQRKPCLEGDETATDYRELAAFVIKQRARRILSFMGYKGTKRVAEILEQRQYNCIIMYRSLKKIMAWEGNITLIQYDFQPKQLHSASLMKALLSQIKPDLCLLKDSGEQGGTQIKKSVFIEEKLPYIGLKMPIKQKGRVFYRMEDLKQAIVERYAEKN